MPLSKTYFLVHSMDYAPDTLIRLGQIISDAKEPYNVLSAPLLPLPQIHTASKYNWTWDRSTEISGSFGLFAKFLSIISGIGPDVEGKFLNGINGAWRSAELYTQFIEPSDKYVEDSVNSVKEVMRGILGKDLYMITGVKIAKQTIVVADTVRLVGAKAAIGVDGMGMGIPLEIGPKGSFEKKQVDKQGFGGSEDFVLAYRLRKVYLRAWSDTIHSKTVKGGELLAHGRDSDDEDSVVDSDEEEEDHKEPVENNKELVDKLVAEVDLEDFGTRILPSGFTRARVVDENGGEECQLMY